MLSTFWTGLDVPGTTEGTCTCRGDLHVWKATARAVSKVSELNKIVSGLGKNSWSPRKDAQALDAGS